MSNKIKIETVETKDFSMEYFKFGHGDKAIVVIPGLSVDGVMKYADMVADAYSSLGEYFTVYVFERRKDIPEDYSIFDMARDTAAAVKSLGLDHIYLYGVSQGGMISMTMAIRNPDLVSKLMLGSTSAAIGSEQYEKAVGKWIEFAKKGDREGLFLSFGEAVYSKEVFDQLKNAFVLGAKAVKDDDLARFIILARAIKDFNVLDELKKISCPVFIVGSEDDNVLGGEASGIIYDNLKDNPDCELYMYNGYGHAVYDTAPDYKERILGFFNKD